MLGTQLNGLSLGGGRFCRDVQLTSHLYPQNQLRETGMSHLKSIAFESEEVSLQKLRERLRLMSDARRVRLIAFTAVHLKFTSGALIEK